MKGLLYPLPVNRKPFTVLVSAYRQTVLCNTHFYFSPPLTIPYTLLLRLLYAAAASREAASKPRKPRTVNMAQ